MIAAVGIVGVIAGLIAALLGLGSLGLLGLGGFLLGSLGLGGLLPDRRLSGKGLLQGCHRMVLGQLIEHDVQFFLGEHLGIGLGLFRKLGDDLRHFLGATPKSDATSRKRYFTKLIYSHLQNHFFVCPPLFADVPAWAFLPADAFSAGVGLLGQCFQGLRPVSGQGLHHGQGHIGVRNGSDGQLLPSDGLSHFRFRCGNAGCRSA